MRPTQEQSLFGNFKVCKFCSKRLPESYVSELCPSCQNEELLSRVKDFIRLNEVNEHQVAEEFNIPVTQVKKWIREGRIEYRTKEGSSNILMHCQRCGAPITFGSLCKNCLKLMHPESQKHGLLSADTDTNNRMRFLDSDK